MKIAHIVCSYPPYYGGMGNVAFQMVEYLREKGHDVVVFTPQVGEASTETQAHVKRLAPSLSYGNAARLPQIKKELEGMDIVHLHYPFFGTASLVRDWKRRHKEKKLVITYHMDTRSPDWKGLIFSLYAKFWMPKILRAADACHVSSFDYLLASDACQVYEEHKEKWTEIPFGVDLERFQPRPKPIGLFQEYRLDDTLPTLLFVGGMDEAHAFKGISVLLRALRRLHRDGGVYQAVFVGDGVLRQQYETEAQILGLSDRVRFVGKISDAELPSYYTMADLLVLPSIAKNEAFGMVLLEAFASGVPVIASDLPGVRSIATRGGVVFPPGDHQALAEQISSFFALPDRAAWGARVRAVAEQEFSWQEIGKRLEDLYTSISE